MIEHAPDLGLALKTSMPPSGDCNARAILSTHHTIWTTGHRHASVTVFDRALIFQGPKALQEHSFVLYRTVRQVLFFSMVCACLNAADSIPSVTAPAAMEAPAASEAPPVMEAPAAIEEEALPILPERAVSPSILEAQLASVRRAGMLAGCKVAPLPEIDDAEALAFEKDAESAALDVQGLMPATAQALESFKDLVSAVGGTFELKSAYRPPAYQAHLHEVWVKWVKELRNNRTAGCRALREEVGAEFVRHQLLLRQQPVTDSDHALGLAFDAAVAMPHAARLNRKRVTVDKLAILAGVRRPNRRRDPVHFKLLPERPGI
jgi:hypothetical protein